MSKQLQSFIIDFKVWFLLLLVGKIFLLGRHDLLTLPSLSCLCIVVIILLGIIDDIIGIVLSPHIE